jgi:hypothetical protein
MMFSFENSVLFIDVCESIISAPWGETYDILRALDLQ